MADEGGEETWQSFSEDCSMHGLKSISSKRRKLAYRILWLLLVLACLGYFVYACASFFTDLSRRTTSTAFREIKVKTMQMPSVTICNANIYRRSAVMNEEHSQHLADLLTAIYGYPQDGRAAERYNWTESPFNSGYFVNSTEFSTLIDRLTYRLEDIVSDGHATMVGSVHYDASEIFQTVETDSGRCVQFNANGSFYTKRTGLFGGLGIQLSLDAGEYYTGPWSQSEGFQVLVHAPNTVPLVTDEAILVSASTDTAIQIDRLEYRRQPPYADGGNANCIDTESLPNPLVYYPTYSYSGCEVECMASYVIYKCGCHYPFHPPINGSKLCAVWDLLSCAGPALDEYYDYDDYRETCDCRAPCNEIKYLARISSFKYPSQFYKEQSPQNENSSQEFALLSVYFGALSYRYIEEKSEYRFQEFVANVGGTLGVCLGASVLTLVEFCEFGLTRLIRRFSRQRDRKTGMDVDVPPAKES